MPLQDGSLVETSGSAEKDTLGKVVRTRAGKLETPKALELVCVPKGEVMDSLPTKFANFSSFVGILVEGFEKEINSLLKKLEARKGRGVKVPGGKKKKKKTFYPLLVLRENSEN